MARFSAAVPAAGLAKLKTKVCQPAATVVVASASTVLVLSSAFSSFSRTGMPASGDQTRKLMPWAVLVKGTVAMLSLAPVDTVVPAHTSDPAALTTLATLPLPLTGSVTRVAFSAPPKPVSTGGMVSSNVTGSTETVGPPPLPPPPPPPLLTTPLTRSVSALASAAEPVPGAAASRPLLATTKVVILSSFWAASVTLARSALDDARISSPCAFKAPATT